jgi:MoaA/NifB/PqqE/SkfB family radical SAM enzyme
MIRDRSSARRVRIRSRRDTDEPAPTDRYDEGRDLADKGFYSSCYAPTVSMYFDQMGDVRACCQNTEGLLGNVREHSIREMWDGDATRDLRAALAAKDFSRGCGFCRWQVDEGGTSPFARGFDRHRAHEPAPLWPVQMEFSMTNSCNLQCVMCNGDWSSSIRTHRERRPPLPVVYGDRFFDELAEFLPHLEQVNFLGGEPFLGKEPLRVMEMLIDMGLDVPVTVTTNATQWSKRIERICDRLNISFVVSLDGIHRQTYESIRIGAELDSVMANIERFKERVDPPRTKVSITHCLMRPNWHEFVDLLRWAEDSGMDSVGINSVVYPEELSLYQMTEEELGAVVRGMELQDAGPATELERFRPVWDAQLDGLRNRLRTLRSGQRGPVDPWPEAASDEEHAARDVLQLVPVTEDEISELAEWADMTSPYRIRCLRGQRTQDGQKVIRPILDVDPRFAQLVDEEAASFEGRPMNDILEAVRHTFGETVEILEGDDGLAKHMGARYRGLPDGEVYEARGLLTEEGDELVLLLALRRIDRD